MKKVALVILALAAVIIIFLLLKGPPSESGTKIDNTKEYPASAADIAGFEKKKTGSAFVVYYHPQDEIKANKSLAVLEQAGLPLFKKYLGLEPQPISVYITTSVDEYVKIADFPGGRENVQVGDGSAPNGKIYLYKPFDETVPGKTGGVIIHEGTHAVMFQYLGQDKMQFLPGFINEGLAYYLEYIFKAGPDFKPLEQIYHADFLISGVKTGEPKILNLTELGQKCDNYIFDETLNFLCRGQGTYTVWSMQQKYGENFWQKFLTSLKQNQDWQKSLTDLTGKTLNDTGQEILDQLQSSVK